MKTTNKTITSLLMAGALIGFGSAANASLAQFRYSGALVVTEYADNLIPGKESMNFKWTITEDDGNFHDISTTLPGTIVTSTGDNKIRPNGTHFDVPIDIGFLAELSDILTPPINSLQTRVDFITNGPGSPHIVAEGTAVNPDLFTTDFEIPVASIDSRFHIHKLDFNGNMISMDLTEEAFGSNTFAAFLLGAKPSGGPAGFGFDINGTVSEVPVPAAFWLFGTGVIGLVARRKKVA